MSIKAGMVTVHDSREVLEKRIAERKWQSDSTCWSIRAARGKKRWQE